jgi:hypothetical protein
LKKLCPAPRREAYRLDTLDENKLLEGITVFRGKPIFRGVG